MNLSERLHGTNQQMRTSIIETIQHSLNAGKSLTQMSKDLYDGYKSGKKVINQADLPDYLKQLEKAARKVANGDLTVLKDYNKALDVAKKNIDKMSSRSDAGTPNQSLLSAYKSILDAAENLSEKALDRAINLGVEERSRSYADRIVRTETARAWYDGFIAKTKDDPLIVGYRWQLSSRHADVPFDQCDVCAGINIGLGVGVYPKNKVPSIPRHPHCACRIVSVFKNEIKENDPIDEDGAKEYLDNLSKLDKQALFGVQGAESYQNGSNWQNLLRGWDGLKDPTTRLSPSDFKTKG